MDNNKIKETIESAMQSFLDEGWQIEYSIKIDDGIIHLEIEEGDYGFYLATEDEDNCIVFNPYFDDSVKISELKSFLHGLIHASCYFSNGG